MTTHLAKFTATSKTKISEKKHAHSNATSHTYLLALCNQYRTCSGWHPFATRHTPSIFDPYHRLLEAGFWTNTAPDAVHAQQVWWIGLFGATIQNVGIWMAALIRLGELHRSRFAWLSLLFGILVWAPQDMWISYTKGVLVHVWIDCFALLIIVPPLLLLAHNDKTNKTDQDT